MVEPVTDPQHQSSGEAMLTDDDLDALVDRQEERETEESGKKDGAEEAKDDKDGKDGSEAGKAPETSEEDQKWLKLKELGVSPEDLVAYAHKGWSAEHAPVVAPAPVVEPEKPKAEPKPKKGAEESTFITREEHEKQMTGMEQRMKVAAAGSHAQSRLATLLDQSGMTETEDAVGRKMVVEETVRLMAQGTPLESAFKNAMGTFSSYIAKATAKEIKKKIANRGAAGGALTGGGLGGDAGPVLTSLDKMEHKGDDFVTGKAFEDAMAFMKDQARGASR